MEGTKDLILALRAGYALFYAQTNEMERAVGSIVKAVNEYESVSSGNKAYNALIWDLESDKDPDVVSNMLDGESPGTVVVAKNFNWFLKDEYGNLNKQLVSYIQNRLELYTTPKGRKALIIVGSDEFDDAIPQVLSKDFLQINFELPDEDEIRQIFESIVNSAKDNPNFKMPDDKEVERIIQSSKGMTRRDVKNAYAYSIIKDGGELKSKTVGIIQASDVEKTPGLKIGEYPKASPLIGYNEAKDFVLDFIDDPTSLGVMLLGPAGTGKTSFARWVAANSGRKCIEMEMAQMMGEGLVGQMQNAFNRAIQVIKANAPCILFIDEIEKGLAGASGGGDSDGGSMKQSAAQFLKFLSDDRPEGVYVMATCNDISQLAPEWVRAERWDCAPFFVDFPNAAERKAIFKHYCEHYEHKAKTIGKFSTDKDCEGWSGAELKAVCRIAATLKRKNPDVKLKDAAKFIKPISLTMAEKVTELRGWAKSRTNPATTDVSKVANGKVEDRKLEF